MSGALSQSRIRGSYLINVASAIVLASSIHSISHAATMDDYVTCGLVYGALFQAAKDAQHEGMLSYTRPRLKAVLPYLDKNRDNPVAKEKLRRTAIRLEDEVRNVFVSQATRAILDQDTVKLKAAMPRVFQCDKVFGLSTLPLPLETKQVPRWNKFLEGFNDGCLAKQKQVASPFSDAQISKYCQCMTDEAAIKGVDASSSEETTGRIIKESHAGCFASIR